MGLPAGNAKSEKEATGRWLRGVDGRRVHE